MLHTMDTLLKDGPPKSLWHSMVREIVHSRTTTYILVGVIVGTVLVPGILLYTFGADNMVPLVLAGTAPLVCLLTFLWLLHTWKQAREAFWKTIAHQRGWKYVDAWQTANDEEALFLNVGHTRFIRTVVEGAQAGHMVRFLESKYCVGYGRNKSTYRFSGFGFKFDATFPHFYLNRKDNRYNLAVGTASKVPLPGTFEDKFDLYAPVKYEVEALQVFTPDVLEKVLAMDFPHDVELVDSELIVFRLGHIKTLKEFESELERATALVNLLVPTLSTIRLTPVGTRPYLLPKQQHLHRALSNLGLKTVISMMIALLFLLIALAT